MSGRECVKQRFPGDDVAASLLTVLRQHQANLPEAAVRRLVGSHRSPGSLLAITDSAQRVGLQAGGAKGDWDALQQVELPVVTQLRGGGRPHFAVVQEVDDDEVCVCDPIRGEVRLPRKAYEQRSTGIYGLFERVGKLRIPLAVQLRQALSGVHALATALGGGLAALVVVALAGSSGWIAPVLGVLAGVGAVVSYLLSDYVLEAKRGGKGGLVEGLCRFAKGMSCGQVLTSPHGKLLGRFPYAYLALGFYAGGLSALAVAGLAGGGFLTAFLALAAPALSISLLFAVRLIYVQARVLKRYCAWCLFLHGLNAACLGVVVLGLLDAASLELTSVLVLGQVWGAAFLAIVGLFLLREQGQALRETGNELHTLRQDPRVVRLSYESAPQEPLRGRHDDGWAVGPKRPRLSLDVVAHPLCHVCAATDGLLQGFLAERAGVRVVTRLLTIDPPTLAPTDLFSGRLTGLKLNGILYAIGAARGPERFMHALSEVLSHQHQLVQAQVSTLLELLRVRQSELAPHVVSGWARLCDDAAVLAAAGVTATPVVFANKRRLPAWTSSEQRFELLTRLHREAKRKEVASGDRREAVGSGVGNLLDDPWLQSSHS